MPWTSKDERQKYTILAN